MKLYHSGDANSIGNRLLAYTGIIPEINLPDRVQLATKLEHFVGSLPKISGRFLSKAYVKSLKILPYIPQNSLNPLKWNVRCGLSMLKKKYFFFNRDFRPEKSAWTAHTPPISSGMLPDMFLDHHQCCRDRFKSSRRPGLV